MRTPAVPVCSAAEQQQKIHRPLGFGESSGTRYRAAAGTTNDLHLESTSFGHSENKPKKEIDPPCLNCKS